MCRQDLLLCQSINPAHRFHSPMPGQACCIGDFFDKPATVFPCSSRLQSHQRPRVHRQDNPPYRIFDRCDKRRLNFCENNAFAIELTENIKIIKISHSGVGNSARYDGFQVVCSNLKKAFRQHQLEAIPNLAGVMTSPVKMSILSGVTTPSNSVSMLTRMPGYSASSVILETRLIRNSTPSSSEKRWKQPCFLLPRCRPLRPL